MANEVNITGGSFTSSNPQAVTVNATNAVRIDTGAGSDTIMVNGRIPSMNLGGGDDRVVITLPSSVADAFRNGRVQTIDFGAGKATLEIATPFGVSVERGDDGRLTVRDLSGVSGTIQLVTGGEEPTVILRSVPDARPPAPPIPAQPR